MYRVIHNSIYAVLFHLRVVITVLYTIFIYLYITHIYIYTYNNHRLYMYIYTHTHAHTLFFNGVILAYILNHIMVVSSLLSYVFLCATAFFSARLYSLNSKKIPTLYQPNITHFPNIPFLFSFPLYLTTNSTIVPIVPLFSVWPC